MIVLEMYVEQHPGVETIVLSSAVELIDADNNGFLTRDEIRVYAEKVCESVILPHPC
jgi:hypothetical protein